jgi:hypothetical protein
MISALELALLLRGSDRDANLNSIEQLIVTGLSTFTTDADAITGLTTTPAGNARLRAMTLPAIKGDCTSRPIPKPPNANKSHTQLRN